MQKCAPRKNTLYTDLNVLLVEVAECLCLSVGGLLSLLDQEAGQTARQEPGHQAHPFNSLVDPEPIGYRYRIMVWILIRQN
jgi:hypothetical protein